MDIRDGFIGAIGNTPLIKLKKASEADRLPDPGQGRVPEPRRLGQGPRGALHHRGRRAEARTPPRRPDRRGHRRQHRHRPRAGRRLAGYKTVIVMPDTQSQEKKDMLRLAGAELMECRPCPTRIPTTTCRSPRRVAEELTPSNPNGAIWAHQFDNLANRRATTAPPVRRSGARPRQGRRLRLRDGYGRNAVRRRDRAAGAQQERADRHRRPRRRGHVLVVHHRCAGRPRRIDRRRHRQGGVPRISRGPRSISPAASPTAKPCR